MRVRLSTLAIALVVVANAVVLAGVAFNRAGDPRAVLELTERELQLPYGRWSGRESTGVNLSIRRADQDYEWLDRDKLADLGFDVADHERRTRYDWRVVERRVHVLLEYDGAAYRRLVDEQKDRLQATRAAVASGEATRRQVEAQERALERLVESGSRLVVIDAAREAAPLLDRRRGQGRFAVMEALVRVHVVSRPGQAEASRELRGRIGPLLPGRIHVPRRFHDALRQATDARPSGYDDPPRYRAVVKFGRSGEPWLGSIESIDGAASAGDP